MSEAPVAKTTKPLSDFDRLTENVLLYTPPGGDSSSGDLILFCSWFAAVPKYITKYTDRYRKELPSARILLVTSQYHDLFRSIPTHRKILDPALTTLKSQIQAMDTGSGSKLLIHSTSSGGLSYLTQLLLWLKENTGRVLDAKLLVLDSAPAKPTYWREHYSLTQAFPSSFPRFLGSFVAHLVLSITALYWMIVGGQERIIRNFYLLNDPELWSTKTDRLYIYSKADKIISWEGVEENAQTAKEKGWANKVDTVCFEESGHTAHAKDYPDQYWEAILKAWAK